jgi:hypothetical protein
MDNLELLKTDCEEYGDDIEKLHSIESPNDITSYQVGATYYIQYNQSANYSYFKVDITKLISTDPNRRAMSVLLYSTRLKNLKFEDTLYVSHIKTAFLYNDNPYNYVLK